MLNKPHISSRQPPANKNRVLNYKINDQIRADKVRLIDETGEAVGIVSLSIALNRAHHAGLDLVEVAATSVPPVCKILDYGREEYEAQKKQKRMKKNTKITVIKEIRIRPRIDDHDYDVKVKQAIRFLSQDNDKVSVCVTFRGRDLDYQDIAFRVVNRMKEDLSKVAKVESEPKLEKRKLHMVFAPLISNNPVPASASSNSKTSSASNSADDSDGDNSDIE